MRNIKLRLSFDGSGYHGFQLQANAITVQGQINEVLKKITGENININGCSRTDAGVHANEFFANFKTDCPIPCDNLMYAMNCWLPGDIAVLSVSVANEGFHSRYDTVKKEYIYKFLNTPVKNPFYRNLALFYPQKIDTDIMNKACADFIGEKDFKAFMAQGSNITATVRTIFEASVIREGDTVIFSVTGDGFLYNMVRIMAGTLLYISEGKIDINTLPGLIENGDRTAMGKTLPACGLYLNRVFY